MTEGLQPPRKERPLTKRIVYRLICNVGNNGLYRADQSLMQQHRAGVDGRQVQTESMSVTMLPKLKAEEGMLGGAVPSCEWETLLVNHSDSSIVENGEPVIDWTSPDDPTLPVNYRSATRFGRRRYRCGAEIR